mmetsp:Transcript_41511/g.83203  ORF Transcript_41511/g.83203 Transcript_41511/m.83203 type:complete len:84 (+) Transcript_41511:87-338(+)
MEIYRPSFDSAFTHLTHQYQYQCQYVSPTLYSVSRPQCSIDNSVETHRALHLILQSSSMLQIAMELRLRCIVYHIHLQTQLAH